ncbi:hypothetical protein EJ06DRAFT_197603 [Trichodelitschia bisporula]|uniref:Uncharacterized protein n=1 Tax=Trichodelitschia bisporula TaxID=703511 RepID=A0A6G1I8G5_9PEZI|nr:hypothetical protein EJ06DRAFT_197603 [Trichodelitschia bisporula]
MYPSTTPPPSPQCHSTTPSAQNRPRSHSSSAPSFGPVQRTVLGGVQTAQNVARQGDPHPSPTCRPHPYVVIAGFGCTVITAVVNGEASQSVQSPRLDSQHDAPRTRRSTEGTICGKNFAQRLPRPDHPGSRYPDGVHTAPTSLKPRVDTTPGSGVP